MKGAHKEILELLTAYIAFESTVEKPDEKKKCADWIEQTFLSEWKHEVHRGAHEGAPYMYCEHPEAEWLWFAHIDVVPAPQEMFTLRHDDEKAYGRGVKDMKGSALPFLIAFRNALQEGGDPKVSLLFTSDEEVAGQTIPHLLSEGVLKAKIAYTPDSVDDGQITVEHKGVLWADVTIPGKGGHAALPWESENPLQRSGDIMKLLQEKFPASEQNQWVTTVTPTQMVTSDARNQIPESVTLGLDIRFPAGDALSPSEALERVRCVLPDDCTIRDTGFSAAPLKTDSEHPFIQKVQKIAGETLGKGVPFGKQGGATDARFFTVAGIPAFIFGPDGGGLHSDSEWVSLASLESHIQFASKLLES